VPPDTSVTCSRPFSSKMPAAGVRNSWNAAGEMQDNARDALAYERSTNDIDKAATILEPPVRGGAGASKLPHKP
jgi:hypothetical protein